MTPSRLLILYATVSGTARQVAEALSLDCSELPPGSVGVQDMHEAEAAVFDPAGPALLLVVATTGSGDLPPDALQLYAELSDRPRYLGGLRYGLIALGDSSYGSTFCGGGQRFDELLLDMGAQRISEVLQLDAMEEDEPEQAAVRWLRSWLGSVGPGQPAGHHGAST